MACSDWCGQIQFANGNNLILQKSVSSFNLTSLGTTSEFKEVLYLQACKPFIGSTLGRNYLAISYLKMFQ